MNGDGFMAFLVIVGMGAAGIGITSCSVDVGKKLALDAARPCVEGKVDEVTVNGTKYACAFGRWTEVD